MSDITVAAVQHTALVELSVVRERVASSAYTLQIIWPAHRLMVVLWFHALRRNLFIISQPSPTRPTRVKAGVTHTPQIGICVSGPRLTLGPTDDIISVILVTCRESEVSPEVEETRRVEVVTEDKDEANIAHSPSTPTNSRPPA